MAAAVLIPGLFLLHVLGARSALAAVLIGLLVLIIPLAWSRNSPTATTAALVIPLGVPVPFILTRTQGISWSGRDCVWDEVVDPRDQGLPDLGYWPAGRLSDDSALARLPGSTPTTRSSRRGASGPPRSGSGSDHDRMARVAGGAPQRPGRKGSGRHDPAAWS